MLLKVEMIIEIQDGNDDERDDDNNLNDGECDGDGDRYGYGVDDVFSNDQPRRSSIAH